MICSYVAKNGNPCKRLAVEGYDLCHVRGHWRQNYDKMVEQKTAQFSKERILVNTDAIEEIEGDGACLFRCLSRGLFYNCGNDLEKLHALFRKTGLMREGFLAEYMDIVECFMSDDFVLETDMEEHISRELQHIICQFIKNNVDLDVGAILGERMTLGTLVAICHEMDVEQYVTHYERYAGDNDYIMDKEKKKIAIDDRWGGTPEIIVFTILFNFSVEIYLPQKLNTMFKAIPILKLLRNTNIHLKKLDKYNSHQKSIKILLRNFKNGAHYDYIK